MPNSPSRYLPIQFSCDAAPCDESKWDNPCLGNPHEAVCDPNPKYKWQSIGHEWLDYRRGLLVLDKLHQYQNIADKDYANAKTELHDILTNQKVYPPIERGKLRTWVGVGGSPESVVRAARHGLPLTLAIIGGSARRFLPYVELYHRSLEKFGKPMQPIAVHSPGHVAATDEQAKEEVWPHFQKMMTRIGAERGWPPMTRDHFEREASPDGALYVGSPETVAAKVAATAKLLGIARFDMKYSRGTLPHDKLMTSIELFGTKVAPKVRELLS